MKPDDTVRTALGRPRRALEAARGRPRSDRIAAIRLIPRSTALFTSVILLAGLGILAVAQAAPSGSWKGKATNIDRDFNYGKVTFKVSGSKMTNLKIEAVTVSGCGGFTTLVIPKLTSQGQSLHRRISTGSRDRSDRQCQRHLLRLDGQGKLQRRTALSRRRPVHRPPRLVVDASTSSAGSDGPRARLGGVDRSIMGQRPTHDRRHHPATRGVSSAPRRTCGHLH